MLEATFALTYPMGLKFRLDGRFMLCRDETVLTTCGTLGIRPGYHPETGELGGLMLSSVHCDGSESLQGREVELRLDDASSERFGGKIDLPFLLPTGSETTIVVDAEIERAEVDGLKIVSIVITGDSVPNGIQYFDVLVPTRISVDTMEVAA